MEGSMRNRGQLIFGGLIILFGIFLLLNNLFQINLWAYCWPAALIFIGVWLFVGPRFSGPDRDTNVLLLGDLRRNGFWTARSQDIWIGIGDVDLDYSQAELPVGETKLRIYSLIGDLDLVVPHDLGVSLDINGAVTDAKLAGGKEESFFGTVEYTSPDFLAAPKRLRVEVLSLINDVTLRIL
jgi:lia operon protein LiaF